MARSEQIPTPTPDSIIEEALKRAGQRHRLNDGGALARGRDVWLPEVMNEIQTYARALRGDGMLKSLHTTAITITIANQSRYAMPTDYDDRLRATLLDGTRGTAVTGAANTITLASDVGLSQSQAEGAYVAMLAGESARQYRQIVSYDADTQVATVDAQWDANLTPRAGDTYMVVDQRYELCAETIYDEEDLLVMGASGRPNTAWVFNEELILDRPPDQTYPILLRYFAAPDLIDYDDPKWTRMLRRMRKALTHGIYVLALQDVDDSRSQQEKEALYRLILPGVIDRELTASDEASHFVLGD